MDIPLKCLPVWMINQNTVLSETTEWTSKVCNPHIYVGQWSADQTEDETHTYVAVFVFALGTSPHVTNCPDVFPFEATFIVEYRDTVTFNNKLYCWNSGCHFSANKTIQMSSNWYQITL